MKQRTQQQVRWLQASTQTSREGKIIFQRNGKLKMLNQEGKETGRFDVNNEWLFGAVKRTRPNKGTGWRSRGEHTMYINRTRC